MHVQCVNINSREVIGGSCLGVQLANCRQGIPFRGEELQL